MFAKISRVGNRAGVGNKAVNQYHDLPDNHIDYLVSDWGIVCAISIKATEFTAEHNSELPRQFKKARFILISLTGNRTRDLHFQRPQCTTLGHGDRQSNNNNTTLITPH